jgi:hypothetical protein
MSEQPKRPVTGAAPSPARPTTAVGVGGGGIAISSSDSAARQAARPSTLALPEGTEEVLDRGQLKSQALGKNLVAALYMLVRSVKLYDPDNAIFQKPLQVFSDSVNALIARDGKLELAVVEGNFYVNGALVRVEQSSMEGLRYLAGEMEARGVGGFNLQRPTTVAELKNFVALFAKDQKEQVGEDGLEGKKLVTLKLTKWKAIKEKLGADADGKVDRKKYAMTVYARTVFFVDHVVGEFRAGKAPPVEKALALVQELVDLIREQRSQFLGMTCNGDGERALTHHLVNTALIAVAFGSELGLSRAQLRELGYAALFADLPLSTLPVQLRFQVEPERLPPQIFQTVVGARKAGIKLLLATGAPTRAQRLLAAVCSEVAVPFGKATRDTRGRITFVLPQGEPLQFSRIAALASYYDLLTSSVPGREAYGAEVALDVMWNQQRQRFDPELLTIFIKVMAQQPVKHLERGAQTVSLG